MDQKQDSNIDELFRLIGICVFASQRIEISFQGIISIFHPFVKDKRFRDINTRSFLEDSDTGKKFRKRTLGTLKDALKEIDILNNEELEKYVIARNFIIHDLYRNELKDAIETNDFSSCIKICKDFLNESDKIERVIKGMFYVIGIAMKSINDQIDTTMINNWSIFEKDLNDY